MILNDFAIEDENGNMITADGNATFEELTNPAFNLNFEAQNFQLLNSTAEDNDLYFGKLTFDASAELTGDLDLPKLNLDLTIKDESDLTYIVPTSQASIEERDGVVVFVNKEDPDNIMTQQADDALDAKISGIELKSNIKIEKQSKVKVVIDKRTNDHISIQGGGDFKFDMDKSGKMDLVGKYNVTTGSVELNLYNLVKRKFEISPKSSVSWSGNPYNADIDLRAIYKIETSASALMASQTAGENLSFQNKYRQELPFLIYMDIKGELTSPKLSFELDMPEDKQGAIDGSVYGRIKQVNQEEDQLNKHVFSLLVLSKFYPDAGSDGSQGGGASIVSKKLNQALSDQLNTFSEKLIGDTGISLNFDVNSYTDYQGNTMEDRTDVDVTAQKKLLDDRLVIEAGSSVNVQGSQRSNESQTGLNNVSVEYLLTEDGRWKLKGFRKSEYENVIDGQVFISGVGLIFTREFNKFKELWSKAYRRILKEEEAETENKKKDLIRKNNNTATYNMLIQLKSIKIYLSLLLLLLISSCSVQKFVPEGKTLYTGSTINLNTKSEKNTSELKTKLNSAIDRNTNSKILGMRLGLYFYYKAQREKPGFINKFLNKQFGEDPYYFQDINVDGTEDILNNRLVNNGYFKSSVNTIQLQDSLKKSTSLKFDIQLSKPYRLKSYVLDKKKADTLAIYDEIESALKQTVIKDNSLFNLNQMKSERERIDTYLKQKGYYNFNSEFLIFEADTNQYDNHRYDLYLRLKKKIPKKSLVPYVIDEVNIHTNRSISAEETSKDTTQYEGYNFIQNKVFFKPKRLNLMF